MLNTESLQTRERLGRSFLCSYSPKPTIVEILPWFLPVFQMSLLFNDYIVVVVVIVLIHFCTILFSLYNKHFSVFTFLVNNILNPWFTISVYRRKRDGFHFGRVSVNWLITA